MTKTKGKPGPKVKPITAAGRRRVREALDRHGLLLVQGQGDVPSVADLLEGAPITTRGYSWDYVPCWIHSHELGATPDVADLKLLRGRRTLVLRRLWPAVDALAGRAVDAVRGGAAGDLPRRFLELVGKNPGIPGEDVKRALGLEGKAGTRTFQRTKNDLASWCCLWPEEQEEAESHTHDPAWLPWQEGKVANGLGRRAAKVDPASALDELVRAVGQGDKARGTRLFPVARWSARR